MTSVDTTILPIEIKAGKSGAMKSLQQFALDKHSALACRFDLNLPTVQNISHKTRQMENITKVDYQLISMPLYMIEVLHEVALTPITLMKLDRRNTSYRA